MKTASAFTKGMLELEGEPTHPPTHPPTFSNRRRMRVG